MSEAIGSNPKRLKTDGALAVYLYRVDDGDDYWYSTIRKVQASADIELVGVATRYTGDQFTSASTLDAFRENVDRMAIDVYWFDDPVACDGLIAEFLYRADWSDDAYLYAAAREEQQFTSHEVVGVVVRPQRDTVEPTRWGRAEFEANVWAVADSAVWFREAAGDPPADATEWGDADE